jgi:hypothetical protein
LTDGTRLIAVENESVHTMPYVAALYDPGGRVYVHGFAQLDYDLNGNPISLNADGQGLRRVDRVTDQTLLFLDGSVGYWLSRNPGQFFGGVVAVGEVHYNKTLERADEVAMGNLRFGNRDASLDLVNSTLGAHALLGRSIVTNAVAFPLTRSDRVFDWEYKFLLNYRY